MFSVLGGKFNFQESHCRVAFMLLIILNKRWLIQRTYYGVLQICRKAKSHTHNLTGHSDKVITFVCGVIDAKYCYREIFWDSNLFFFWTGPPLSIKANAKSAYLYDLFWANKQYAIALFYWAYEKKIDSLVCRFIWNLQNLNFVS